MKYKNLTYIIKEIIADNYGSDMRKPEDWEWPTQVLSLDLDMLEEMASRLSTREKIVLACGEDGEAREIARRYKIKPLHNFLCEVFDGCYADNFMPEL